MKPDTLVSALLLGLVLFAGSCSPKATFNG